MRIALTLVQVLGVLVALYGLFLLAGLAWAVLVGGILITGSAVVVEIVRLRDGGSGRGSMEGS